MANEITVLESYDGGSNYNVLFIYPIATPVQIGNVNVIPTPSTSLPSGAATQVLTNTEKNALDAGTTAFEVVQFQKDGTATPAQMLTRVKEIYGIKKTNYLAAYDAKYKVQLNGGTATVGSRYTYP